MHFGHNLWRESYLQLFLIFKTFSNLIVFHSTVGTDYVTLSYRFYIQLMIFISSITTMSINYITLSYRLFYIQISVTSIISERISRGFYTLVSLNKRFDTFENRNKIRDCDVRTTNERKENCSTLPWLLRANFHFTAATRSKRARERDGN